MVTTDLLKSDQQRLRAAEAEAAAALKACEEAQERLDRANKALQAWRVIVAQHGASNEEPFLQKIQEPTEDIKFDGNKAAWLRNVIFRYRNEGIAPAKMRQLAKSVGIKVTRQFPYTTLYGLKESGKVREENGRYYPSTLLLASSKS